MKCNSFSLGVAWAAVILLIWIDDAQAYIDPGTGGMLFQALIAGVVGGLFLLKKYWLKMKGFFRKNNKIKS
jgi:hypothetical protein